MLVRNVLDHFHQILSRIGAIFTGNPAAAAKPVTCSHCGARFGFAQLDYGAKLGRLPDELAAKFVRLERDTESNQFLQRCLTRAGPYRYILSFFAKLLRAYMSLTSANGLLGRGKMFVFSKEHARLLVEGEAGESEAANARRRDSGVLLDVGAGDGNVTQRLQPYFASTVVTEVSLPMVQVLRRSGKYAAVVHSEGVADCARVATEAGVALPSGGTRFDGIALLNVLDRCDTPLTLMRQLHRLLEPETGRLILAVVLPFRPFVEAGSKKRPPRENLRMNPNATWEASVAQLYENVIKPGGFQVERLSRLPYMCEGDWNSPVYTLDDAVFVLSVPRK